MRCKRIVNGSLESAVTVFAFVMAAEILLRAIPGLSSHPADTVVTVRLALFGGAALMLGYYLQTRYDLRVSLAALAFAFGIALSAVLRGIRDDLEGHVQTEDLGFLMAVAVGQWCVLLIGAAAATWRGRAANRT